VTPSEEQDLAEALRLARRELTLSRTREEAARERLQRARRERALLRKQVRLYAATLDRLLTERYWAEQPTGLTARLRRSGDATSAEREQVAELEGSGLFDGAWYLQQQPDAVRELLSPAVHYLRVGAAAGAEPGPTFDSVAYLEEHPEAQDDDVPVALHAIRRNQGLSADR
jgi:hypothetical protein